MVDPSQGSQKCIFHALSVVVKMRAGILQMIIRRDRLIKLGISNWTKIAIFLCKLRFRTHVFIVWGQTHIQKNHEKLTVRRRVNPYGQPDRKISVFL